MKIGLALSGGGFRATLFHLGVLQYLSRAGALTNVSAIASSSGGSLAAAMVGLALTDLRNGKDFDQCVIEPILRLTRLGLRERVLRRLPWLWFSRYFFRNGRLFGWLPVPGGRLLRRLPASATELLAQYYDSVLFRGARLTDLGQASTPTEVLILATNASEGGITIFGADSIRHLPANLDAVADPIPAGLLKIASAVAASSAFPAFFPPIDFTHADVGADDALFRRQQFTDAGVSDNLAFDSLVRVRPDLDLVIVSDAGRSNVPISDHSFSVLRNAIRSSDLMLFRISELARERARTHPKPLRLLSISHTTKGVPGEALDVIQRPLERLRTDFDQFSALEVRELIRHGWCVAAAQLASPELRVEGPSPYATPAPKLPSSIAERLERGAFRRAKIFSARDWLAWAYGVGLSALLGATIYFAPAAYQATSNYINILRASRLLTLEVPRWVDAPLQPSHVVKQLPPDKNDDFRLIAEDRVWDLRRLRPQAQANSVTMLGPAFLLRSARLELKNESMTTYRFRFLTSGNELRAWRVGGEPITVFSQERLEASGPSTLNTFIVETDVQNQARRNEPIQVQAQILDAFRERNNWWTGMRVTSDVERISMRVVFPRDYPFKRGTTRFTKYPNETPLAAEAFDGLVLQKEESELIWYVDRPTTGFTYRVSWDW